MQYGVELQWRPGTRHQFPDALPRSRGNKDRGATVGDSFPGDNTTKRTYRGPQGPVLDGVPLGQLRIEGINNDNALPLTVLAAITFTPDLPPVDTNPVGHRSRTHLMDSAPILPKAVVVGCGGGGGCIRSLDNIFGFKVSPATTGEHWSAPARMVWQPAQCSSKFVQEIRSAVPG